MKIVVSDEEVVSLLCGHGDCKHVGDLSVEWIADTGAVYHCIPRRELFTTYRGGNLVTPRWETIVCCKL